MNINRGVVLLICDTHSLGIAHLWRREVAGEGGESDFFDLLVGFTFLPFWGIYIKEDFAGFFPLGFSQGKSVLFL